LNEFATRIQRVSITDGSATNFAMVHESWPGSDAGSSNRSVQKNFTRGDLAGQQARQNPAVSVRVRLTLVQLAPNIAFARFGFPFPTSFLFLKLRLSVLPEAVAGGKY